MLKAVLACVCNEYSVFRASVARKFNDVNERRLIIFLVNKAFVNALAD